MNLDELTKIAEASYAADKNREKQDSDLQLFKGHIVALKNLERTGRIHNPNSDLTESELLSIVILEGFGSSRLIQSAAYTPSTSNPFKQALIDSLDSALRKIPKCTHRTLYANNGYEKFKNHVGENFTVAGFLTTSKDDFCNARRIKWIITPLPPHQTRAHEIYHIYNHGDDCDNAEWQVEFERNTSFKVTRIVKGKSFDTVYIEELPG